MSKPVRWLDRRALWGLAVLTRETVLYFLPLAALWLGWRVSASVPRRLRRRL